jgi:hypothetical protein
VAGLMADSDHKDALEAYKICSEAAEDNERSYEEDTEFWRLDKQWPEAIKKARSTPGQQRPMFTFNRGPTFARQVINEIRQNRPQIKVRPADSGADLETALVQQGLIRNINVASKGDVARDTAAECMIYGGFGYYRIDIEYACDDAFDKEIRINRIVNPLCIKGDPYSTRADSLDWNMAFEIDLMTPEAFKEQYPKADPVSFDMMDDKVRRDWSDGDDIVVASYWKRNKVMKKLVRTSDGHAYDKERFFKKDEETRLSQADLILAEGVTVNSERPYETYETYQCILNGQETLTDKVRWVGKYIPIIPVYGEEMHFKGKRMFWSMLHRARDAQEQFNYHETTATELYALSPRIPFIGEEGFADIDPRWATANTLNHPYLEHKKGTAMPQRQPLDAGPMIGAMSLSKSAGDNLKAVLGMYDASIGQRSNETSGRAIDSRKMEADVGNFHFSDNVSRAIECEGTQLLDLIPKVYTKDRIVRILGEDGVTQDVKLAARQPGAMSPERDPNAPPPKIGALAGVYDLSAGKYDLTVEAGPSYSTQRQETAAVIGELIRANPAMMQIGGDIMVSNLDLKGGDELSRRMKKMLPPPLQDEQGPPPIPPEVEQMIEQGKAMIQELQQENEQLKQDEVGKVATIQKAEADKDKNAVEREKTALARARIPIEQAQADAALLQKQIELETTRAQLGATQAATETTQATGNAIEVITQAAAALAQTTAALTQTVAAIQNAVAAPKRKQMTIQKVNGAYVGQSVEMPEMVAQ